MTFRVGQKVIRIGSSDPEQYEEFCRTYGLSKKDYVFPEVGEIVTVRTINVWPRWTLLTFYEFDNSSLQKKLGAKYEPGFGADHFRPLVERKTDITVFTEILRKSSKPARGPVVALQDRP